MCTSPIKRKNPSKDPLAKEYIYTPCGKCLSCQKTKQDGIEYRALKEYDWTIAHGGQVYFITFTYDDAHLPHVIFAPAARRIGSKFVGVDTSYPFRADLGWFQKMSCFDKQDIQKFNKRLRSRLKYYNFHVDISFLIVSEYGSDREYISSTGELRKATQRPHYHAIYFITPSQREWTKKRSKPNEHLPSKTTFLNMSYDCWKKCEPYCFKEYLIDNKPLSAISYTAKYITKQQSDEIFSRNLPKHPSVFLMETDEVIYDGHNYVKKYEEVPADRIMPFSTVSNNFGCKHLLGRTVKELSALMSKHTSITNQNGSIYSIPFPSYYIKKFLYTSEKSVEYVPAPIDIEALPLRTKMHIETDYYLQEHVTTKVHEAHFEQHLANQYYVIENNYAKLCAVWYESENKPFSEDFLKSCLKDYLACKCAKVDYFCGTGEIIESPNTLEYFVFDTFYKDRSVEERARLLNSLECFITMVQVERNYQKRSKLIIQKEKQNKRSAQIRQSIHLRHAHQFKASAVQRHKKRV